MALLTIELLGKTLPSGRKPLTVSAPMSVELDNPGNIGIVDICREIGICQLDHGIVRVIERNDIFVLDRDSGRQIISNHQQQSGQDQDESPHLQSSVLSLFRDLDIVELFPISLPKITRSGL